MKDFESQKIKGVIKELLKKKKVTYENVAEELGCSVPTVKRILGPEELTLNRLLQLCEIAGTDLAELQALSQENLSAEEKYTPDQEAFLAKNKNFMAYLMKLFEGQTPKEIAEENKLTQRSTDRYLIGLEKFELIRVTGKQKVKPNFRALPGFKNGPLARAYSESLIQNNAAFFSNFIIDAIRNPKEHEAKKNSAKFGLQTGKVTNSTYKIWVDEQRKAVQNFAKLASYEEKSKDPTELMTYVIIEGHALVENTYSGLHLLDNAFGEITNL